MNILRSFLFYLVCGVIAFLWIDAAPSSSTKPYYSLSGQYYFDGTSSNFVPLTNLVCVKGNIARSIQFQMKTSTMPPATYGVIIGMIIVIWFIANIS